MTKEQIQALIDACRTSPTDLVTWLELKAVLEGLKNQDGVTSFNTRIGDVLPIEGDYSLTQLSDVTITTPSVDNVLMWNGTTWVNVENYANKVQHLAKLAANITKGKAVYVSGASGNNILINLASNDSEASSSKVLGLTLSGGITNENVYVVSEGLIVGVDTSTATAGDPVWLGTNGNLLFGAANKPVAPAHQVYIGVVTRVGSSNGEIFVNVQNGFEIEELHDVLITSKTDKDLIYYDSATSLWKNAQLSTILGYTPADNASLANYQLKSEKGLANGYASLDSAGKVPVSQLPSSIMEYKGVWDASTNTPTLADGTGDNGDVYRVSVGGTINLGSGNITFDIGDYVIYNGTIWQKSDTTDAVASVFGRTGVIVATEGDYNLNLLGDVTITSVANNDIISYNSTSGLWENKTFSTLGIISSSGGTTNYIPRFSGSTTLTDSLIFDNGLYVLVGGGGNTDNIKFQVNGDARVSSDLYLGAAIKKGLLTFTLPSATGTLALTSDLGAYLPLTGGTLTGALNGTSATFSGDITISTSSSPSLFITNTSANGRNYRLISKDDGNFVIQRTGIADLVTISQSGNIGIGVTPSAWGSNVTALQLPQAVSLYAWNASAVPQMYLGANNYFDGSVFKYSITGQTASLYYQGVGQHIWYTAPSGTAGNTISFTQAMTLDASGRLGIGTSTISAKVHIKQNTTNWYDGIRVFNGSSNTWTGVGNTGSLAVISSSYDNTGSYLPLAFYTSDTERMRITSGGNLEINGGSLKTGNASGSGTGPAWRLGPDQGYGTNYTPTRSIAVQIDGVIYYLQAVAASDI